MPLYELQGRSPKLGRDVYVAANATVIGDVALGDEASVWFGTVLRGDMMPIVIGARTNLQDGSVVHVTTGRAMTVVGDDVTVGHRVLLHGCTIGNRVLIGMGSTLLDGSVVEDDAILGAGSLLTPGARVPSGCLALGRPARVIRPLNDSDHARIREGRDAYVEAGRLYASGAFRRMDE
jgi:carbonic anhydrase/acetyltransferase-like protein (isoleucine patch superfamily)